MESTRSSGILLHITSLPGPFGIGDIGPEARRFADLLADAGQSIWQVLPLVPVGHGNSPYSSPSTFAGNPYLISPDLLAAEGWLEENDLQAARMDESGRVDFDAVRRSKQLLLEAAYRRYRHGKEAPEFEDFRRINREWLDDYALFMALRDHYEEVSWTEWPDDLVSRKPEALEAARKEYAERIEAHAFWQYLFDRQWSEFKTYVNGRGIRIFGDVPIYVAHDSADVWANQDLFRLDDAGCSTHVAGVPPDYFSETGQRWGNPLYDWARMKETGYDWWIRRLGRVLSQVDIVRLDHFRAFYDYWEIEASEETAVHGHWRKGPAAELFQVVKKQLGDLPIVAEDLGDINDGVRNLMKELGYPGMAVLHFAFYGNDEADYLPHNFKENLVAYTGTHDNDTTRGWWQSVKEEHNTEARKQVLDYIDAQGQGAEEVTWGLIGKLMASKARSVIVPMQDLLGLDSDARMNTPGVSDGNWGWRLSENYSEKAVNAFQRLGELSARFKRVDAM